MNMEIEVSKPYMGGVGRENEHVRIISISGDTYFFELMVGVMSEVLMGNGPLHRVAMVIGTNFTGDMKLIKNRYGRGDITNHREIRDEILNSLESVGFSTYEGFAVICEVNKAIAEILGEPVIQNEIYPLGINYSAYMKRGYWVKSKIKIHKLI